MAISRSARRAARTARAREQFGEHAEAALDVLELEPRGVQVDDQRDHENEHDRSQDLGYQPGDSRGRALVGYDLLHRSPLACPLVTPSSLARIERGATKFAAMVRSHSTSTAVDSAPGPMPLHGSADTGSPEAIAERAASRTLASTKASASQRFRHRVLGADFADQRLCAKCGSTRLSVG